MVIKEAVALGIKSLEGVRTAVLDTHLLLCEAMNISRIQLLTQGEQRLATEEERSYTAMINRRAEGEPVQYILGRCEFMSLNFKVSPDVLIPRPDTEALVETVLELIKTGKVLEIGTGSGCIAISMAYYNRDIKIDALDISDKALAVAWENAGKIGVDNRITFINRDIFEGIEGEYDAIISNPPYIKSDIIPTLQKEVLKEPITALDGGADGMNYYRFIVDLAPKILKKDGILAFEVGHDQSSDVEALMQRYFNSIQCVEDLSGISRVLWGYLG